MSQNRTGKVIIFVIVGSIITIATLLAISLFSGTASNDPRGPVSRPETTTPAMAPSDGETLEGGRVFPPVDPRFDGSQPQGTIEDEAEMEAIREQSREAARAINDGNDPTPCESVCDCPQGWDCQQGSQLCIPSPFPVYCCDNDGCPEGAECRHEDGRYGTCDVQ